jgi:hypothetical protein
VKTEASSGALIPTPKVIPKSPMCSPKRIAPSQLLWPKARELTAAISVSVCDAYGHLVAHQRMDNVFMDAIRESIGKAVAAAESASPSGEKLSDDVYHR